MPNAIDRPESQRAVDRDVAWGAVWTGFALALLGTLAAGTWTLVFAGKGTWWAANIGTLCLFCGVLFTGWRARTAEPLNGAFIAVFYFSTAVLVIFSGEFLGVLPDPLPGLPRGDSTFFFVWPLEQLAAGTLGAMLGGWLWERRHGVRAANCNHEPVVASLPSSSTLPPLKGVLYRVPEGEGSVVLPSPLGRGTEGEGRFMGSRNRGRRDENLP